MSELGSITLVGALAAISPGADFALLVRNALGGSRRDGLMTAAGIALGVLVHVSYTVLGLAALVSATPSSFRALQVSGALYLIYLGCTGLWARPAEARANPPSNGTSSWQALRAGFLCNALNPKTMVFFLAIFATVLPAEVTAIKRAMYGLEIAFLHWVWFSVMTLLIGSAMVKRRLQEFQWWVGRVLGVVLVGMGGRILLMAFGAS